MHSSTYNSIALCTVAFQIFQLMGYVCSKQGKVGQLVYIAKILHDYLFVSSIMIRITVSSTSCR